MRYGVPADRLDTVPNFVPQPDVSGARRGDDWLFVGRLSRDKGIVELLRQWPEDRRLVVVGTGPQDDEARALFPVARQHWERVEPVAESFGDLDPKTDAREADLEPGQKWTGWHRIEKDLWPPASGYTALTPAQRKVYANDLLANVKTLDKRVQTLKLTVDQIGNGSKGLLDEVAARFDIRIGASGPTSFRWAAVHCSTHCAEAASAVGAGAGRETGIPFSK